MFECYLAQVQRLHMNEGGGGGLGDIKYKFVLKFFACLGKFQLFVIFCKNLIYSWDSEVRSQTPSHPVGTMSQL